MAGGVAGSRGAGQTWAVFEVLWEVSPSLHL